jgi:hypothetical protein
MQAMNKRQLVGDGLTYCEQAFNVPLLWIEWGRTSGKGWTIACRRCKGKMVELGGWLSAAASQAICWGQFRR